MAKVKSSSVFVLCSLIGVLFCLPAWVQEGPSSVRQVRFHVTPSNAKVYQVGLDGQVDALGIQGEKLTLELPSNLTGDRPVIFRFSVPQWFGGEYPDWGQVQGKGEEVLDLTLFQIQANKDELNRGAIPAGGVPFSLPLPATVAFQAWTLGHPVLTLFLLALSGLLVAAVIYRHKLLALLPRNATPVKQKEVDGYDLRNKLGEGGMGEVWAATSVNKLNCALKFIRKELAQNEDFKARFEREIKACLPLSHPYLLKLYGYGVATDGRLYTVSELLLGDTLKAVIKSQDYDPPQLAAQVLEQIGDALYYLHERKLIHRDVKPDNIFVCEDGSMKLMDMGLIEGEDLTVITQTGHMLGTPAYMPPEQMDSEGGSGQRRLQADRRTSPASDQYALGIILYEILAGERPFLGPTANMMIYQHAHVAPLPPSEIKPHITPETDHAILRMIMKKPGERFPTIKEAQMALEPLGFMSWKDTTEDTQQAAIRKIQP